MISLILTLLVLTVPETRAYPATVSECYDGDTCTVDIDLGLDIVVRGQRVRLAGVDAWELRGAERPRGLVARDWINGLLAGRDVRLVVEQRRGRDRRGKYGRLIAVIWHGTTNVNQRLVALGHGEVADYD